MRLDEVREVVSGCGHWWMWWLLDVGPDSSLRIIFAILWSLKIIRFSIWKPSGGFWAKLLGWKTGGSVSCQLSIPFGIHCQVILAGWGIPEERTGLLSATERLLDRSSLISAIIVTLTTITAFKSYVVVTVVASGRRLVGIECKVWNMREPRWMWVCLQEENTLSVQDSFLLQTAAFPKGCLLVLFWDIPISSSKGWLIWQSHSDEAEMTERQMKFRRKKGHHSSSFFQPEAISYNYMPNAWIVNGHLRSKLDLVWPWSATSDKKPFRHDPFWCVGTRDCRARCLHGA